MSGAIHIRCPLCGREDVVDRTPQDPQAAVLFEIACEDCAPDGPPSVTWYGPRNEIILRIEMEPDTVEPHGAPA